MSRAHRAILALPEHFRVPLLLRDMLELPTANVAAALGVRPETLKTRLHRARLLVRRAMLERLPSRPAPAPLYERQVCLDLLTAKLDALDASRPFPVADSVLCERCRAVFAELDLAHELGAGTSGADLPQRLRRALVAATDAPCDPVLA